MTSMPELTDEKLATALRLIDEGVIEIAGPDHLTALACAMRFGEIIRRTCIASQQALRDLEHIH